MAGDDPCEEVRRHCAAIAESARWVEIDTAAGVPGHGRVGLDAELHLLDAPAENVARYVLILDAINFGSGWFPTLARSGDDESLTDAMTRRLTEHARRRGAPWTAQELREVDAALVAEVLAQDPAHELMALYAEALNQLGGWLGQRSALEAIGEARGSARAFVRALRRGMPFFDDRGFLKRAQITANDLALAGVTAFDDIDQLTVFADNLLPHVLRLERVLRYDPELTAAVDGGRLLKPGSRMEVEIRACALHACELLARHLDVAPRTLDNWLWNRGNHLGTAGGRPHLTRTVFY